MVLDKKRVLTIILSLSLGILGAQSSVKLVVGVVIDQMRSDYIHRYWNKLGNDGFKRLIREGFYYKNANYNYVPTFTGPGHASIFTGTTPEHHGIIANEWYNKSTREMQYCVSDLTEKTVGTDGKVGQVSSRNMLSTTLGDELRLHYMMKSKVIAVSLKDRSAALPAGHCPNGAYWLDGKSGKFVSSSYFMKELPAWVQAYNKKERPKKLLELGWKPLLDLNQYTESLADENPYEDIPENHTRAVFPYDYSKDIQKSNFEEIKETPWGNTLITEMALEAIKNEQLGKDEFPDLLALSYSSMDFIGHDFGPKSVEIEDAYLRLDKEIAQLLNELDAQVGKDKYVFFLTADHGACDVPAYLSDNKIPSGYYQRNNVLGRLNAYLYRMHGDSTLALNYTNQQLFLDHARMENKKLDKEKIYDACIDFMLDEKGVSQVFSAPTLRENAYPEGNLRSLIQRGFHFVRSGDIVVCLQPGWMEHKPVGTTHGVEFSYDTHVPLLWFGAGVSAGDCSRHVNITDIMPTICMWLNVPFPNACTGKVLDELTDKKK